MRKARFVLIGVGACLALLFGVVPAGANHGPEGCIVTVAAHACGSSGGAGDVGPGATGAYTITAGHTLGVTGVGPYTIEWGDPAIGDACNNSYTAAPGQTDNQVHLADAGCTGTTVTATSTGGIFAVGDRD